MPIAALIDNPEDSRETYDEVRTQLGLEEEAPAGGILHVAGPSPDGGWRIVEVWESQEDADRFVAGRPALALGAVGIAGRAQPQIWPVHSYIT